jgi:osmotically-inducible protein OsmY
MKTFLGFLLGLAAGAALTWWYLAPAPKDADRAQARLEKRAARAADKAEQWREKLAAKIEAFELDPGTVKDEIAQTGQVVRRKARVVGDKVADATADARITTAVKAKLALDDVLSAWEISVATAEGRVTLAGTVDSAADVGRATAIALEVDGVREVVSTLTVKGGG